MSASLKRFYFHDPRAFVIPVEHLNDAGMSAEFAGWLKQERNIDQEWIELFNDAFATYRQRAAELEQKNPENWFPPRKQNVCVVIDERATRPYYQPFNKCSWLMYASDFDARSSHRELACYLFLHTERLGLAQNPAAAVAHNLGYWLLRSDDEVAAFADAASRCTRPDAEAFVALAKSLEWIRKMHHPTLRPLLSKPEEPVGQLPQSGLIATASMQPLLVELVGAFRASVTEVAQRYFAHFAAPPASTELCDWLKANRPSVLLTGAGGDILWDPEEHADTARLADAIGGIPTAAAHSIRADIEVAHDRTRRFLAAIRDPDALALPGEDIEQSGLTYIHAHRKLIAYNVFEPDMNRTAEPAAPYERLMLGARTLHEWAHLAVDAAIVRVVPGREGELADAEQAFADRLQEIVDAAPDALAEVAEEERQRTGARSLGLGLKDTVLGRIDDYLANMLARRLLNTEEMETYVRQQVTSLVQEDAGPFGQIARHSYELQYLALSAVDDPMRYFNQSTWFPNTFVDAGIVTMARFEALVAAMRSICACYAIDSERVALD